MIKKFLSKKKGQDNTCGKENSNKFFNNPTANPSLKPKSIFNPYLLKCMGSNFQPLLILMFGLLSTYAYILLMYKLHFKPLITSDIQDSTFQSCSLIKQGSNFQFKSFFNHGKQQ